MCLCVCVCTHVHRMQRWMDARYQHQMSSSIISHLLGGQTKKLAHLAGLAGQQAPAICLAGMAIINGYTWVLWMEEEDHIQVLSHLSHKHFAYSASPQLSEVVIISKTQWEKSTIVIPVACGYNGNGNTEGAGLLFFTLQPEGACVADMRPEGSPRKTLIIPDVFLFASQLCRRNQEHSKFYE